MGQRTPDGRAEAVTSLLSGATIRRRVATSSHSWAGGETDFANLACR